MNTYVVKFNFIVEGNIKVSGKSKEDAEKKFKDLTTEHLVLNSRYWGNPKPLVVRTKRPGETL